MDSSTELFSREELAGYGRERLAQGCVVLVGCGAAGTNAAQTLALAGVGEVRFVDFDHVETSNLTRSPLFRAERLRSARPRYKAHECAKAFLETSYAEAPRARAATARIEDLGHGAFSGAHVILSALDSMLGRAYLADVSRLLGVPLVEVGFSRSRGQISVYPNAAPEEPCWRCLHPEVLDGSASCSLYARRVVDTGRIAATQPLAATFAALAVEAVILALHGEFPLGGTLVTLDIRDGQSRRLSLTHDPECPGAHRRFEGVRAISASANDPVTAIFTAIEGELDEPVLHLPAPFVESAPCASCGTSVSIQKLARTLREPPRCWRCQDAAHAARTSSVPAMPSIVTELRPGDELAKAKGVRLGLRSGMHVELTDRASDRSLVVALAGGPDELFVTRERRSTNSDPTDEGFTPLA